MRGSIAAAPLFVALFLATPAASQVGPTTLPIAQTVNLTRQLKAYRDAGLVVAGLAAEASVPLHEFDQAADGLVLVVGSEGKGMGRLVREHCDVLLRIPMTSAAESLNAGVAAGVALYEIARQRGR